MCECVSWASHLKAHDVDQGLVGDGDLAQQLGDGHPWDGVEERHKEGKDWTQTERDKERERERKGG